MCRNLEPRLDIIKFYQEKESIAMKLLFVLLTIFVSAIILLIQSYSYAQEMEDVVYLKNGGIIRGLIVEQIPGTSIKIRTKDGNVFVFKIDEFSKITKEEVYSPSGPSRRRDKVSGEKSEVSAVFLAWVIPTLGHHYAKDWDRGKKFLGLEVLSLIIAVSGSSLTETDQWGNKVTTDQGEALIAMGILGFVGFRIWEFVDAYHTAKDYNESLRQSYNKNYNVMVSIREHRPIVGLSYHF